MHADGGCWLILLRQLAMQWSIGAVARVVSNAPMGPVTQRHCETWDSEWEEGRLWYFTSC